MCNGLKKTVLIRYPQHALMCFTFVHFTWHIKAPAADWSGLLQINPKHFVQCIFYTFVNIYSAAWKQSDFSTFPKFFIFIHRCLCLISSYHEVRKPQGPENKDWRFSHSFLLSRSQRRVNAKCDVHKESIRDFPKRARTLRGICQPEFPGNAFSHVRLVRLIRK